MPCRLAAVVPPTATPSHSAWRSQVKRAGSVSFQMAASASVSLDWVPARHPHRRPARLSVLKRAGRLAEERRPGPSGKPPAPSSRLPGDAGERHPSHRSPSAFVGLNALQLLSQPPRLHQASAIFFRDILPDVIWPKSGQNVKMSRKNVTKTQVRPHGREVGELCQGWRGDEPRV